MRAVVEETRVQTKVTTVSVQSTHWGQQHILPVLLGWLYASSTLPHSTTIKNQMTFIDFHQPMQLHYNNSVAV